MHQSPKQPLDSSSTTSTPIPIGKRKASTTHPYSQSEAFANRHHHCERTDELDRGIWTYFGPGGTKEAPTVAGKKEMYLRCNHDGCMRIDWKTVHGLQCHIVKSHGIPKGTIGSLELALEKYGVEVEEIEGHEKEHGPGSAGIIADKGTRGRPRSRPSHEMVMLPPSGPPVGPAPASISAPPAKSTPTARSKASPVTVLFPNLTARSPSGGYMQDDIVYSEDESDSYSDSVGDDSSFTLDKRVARKSAVTGNSGTSDPDLSTPPISRVHDEDNSHEPISRSAPTPPANPQKIVRLKSLQPRPTSSTDTLAIPESVPATTSTESHPPLAPPSNSLTTQTPPIGTETQEMEPAAQKVNASVEVENPDFIAGKPIIAESDTLLQTQGQDPAQTQTQTQTQPQPQDPATTIPSADTGTTTKNPSSSTSNSSRPRGGADKRVRASERWDWAPISSSSDDDHNHAHHPHGGVVGGSGPRKRSTVTTTTLTKAQQELQGLDGVDEAVEGIDRDAGGDGAERGGGGGAAGNGSGSGNASLRSPMTSRYSARTKKARRRVD